MFSTFSIAETILSFVFVFLLLIITFYIPETTLVFITFPERVYSFFGDILHLDGSFEDLFDVPPFA